ncbi:hypothetical protein V8F33_006357 [Rhypophila sp. PSN 637]
MFRSKLHTHWTRRTAGRVPHVLRNPARSGSVVPCPANTVGKLAYRHRGVGKEQSLHCGCPPAGFLDPEPSFRKVSDMVTPYETLNSTAGSVLWTVKSVSSLSTVVLLLRVNTVQYRYRKVWYGFHDVSAVNHPRDREHNLLYGKQTTPFSTTCHTWNGGNISMWEVGIRMEGTSVAQRRRAVEMNGSFPRNLRRQWNLPNPESGRKVRVCIGSTPEMEYICA